MTDDCRIEGLVVRGGHHEKGISQMLFPKAAAYPAHAAGFDPVGQFLGDRR